MDWHYRDNRLKYGLEIGEWMSFTDKVIYTDMSAGLTCCKVALKLKDVTSEFNDCHLCVWRRAGLLKWSNLVFVMTSSLNSDDLGGWRRSFAMIWLDADNLWRRRLVKNKEFDKMTFSLTLWESKTSLRVLTTFRPFQELAQSYLHSTLLFATLELG